MKNTRTILIVEDVDEDFTILAWGLKEAGVVNPLKRCSSFGETMAFLTPAGVPVSPAPACIVLLDLNLPDAHGSEVLQKIRQFYQHAALPIIVYSTGSNPKTIRACYAAGATSYVVKPLGLAAVERFIGALRDWWLEQVEMLK